MMTRQHMMAIANAEADVLDACLDERRLRNHANFLTAQAMEARTGATIHFEARKAQDAVDAARHARRKAVDRLAELGER
jgi:hypothetical protein